jgi:hypothetical protein
MKKPYQIAAGRALQRMRQWAEEKNPTVQLVLPMVEILALANEARASWCGRRDCV